MDRIQVKKYYEEPRYRYNLISVCVFRIMNSYKETTKYYYGLQTLIKLFPIYFPDFYLRIYHDKTIMKTDYVSPDEQLVRKIETMNRENKEMWKPLILQARKHKKIQVVKYKHPDFMVDENFHQGLFGTFVRFMPLFDYDENSNIGTVFVSDIDVNKFALESVRDVYKMFKPSVSKIHYRSRYCYNVQPRYDYVERHLEEKYVPRIPYRVLAGTIICKIKLPKQLLDEFMTCMKDTNIDDCKYIKNFTDLRKIKEEKLLKDYDMEQKLLELTDFFYGIDEFFINTTVLKYVDTNKIPISVTPTTDIFHPIYNNYLRWDKFEDISDDIVKFYKDVMGRYYNDKISLAKNYEHLDKVIYNVHSKSDDKRKEEYEFIYKKFIDMLKKIDDNNELEKYRFTKEEVSCISRMDKDVPYGEDFKLYDYATNKGGSYYSKYMKYKKKYAMLKKLNL